jgi:hypothetical protein
MTDAPGAAGPLDNPGQRIDHAGLIASRRTESPDEANNIRGDVLAHAVLPADRPSPCCEHGEGDDNGGHGIAAE